MLVDMIILSILLIIRHVQGDNSTIHPVAKGSSQLLIIFRKLGRPTPPHLILGFCIIFYVAKDTILKEMMSNILSAPPPSMERSAAMSVEVWCTTGVGSTGMVARDRP